MYASVRARVCDACASPMPISRTVLSVRQPVHARICALAVAKHCTGSVLPPGLSPPAWISLKAATHCRTAAQRKRPNSNTKRSQGVLKNKVFKSGAGGREDTQQNVNSKEWGEGGVNTVPQQGTAQVTEVVGSNGWDVRYGRVILTRDSSGIQRLVHTRSIRRGGGKHSFLLLPLLSPAFVDQATLVDSLPTRGEAAVGHKRGGVRGVPKGVSRVGHGGEGRVGRKGDLARAPYFRD